LRDTIPPTLQPSFEAIFPIQQATPKPQQPQEQPQEQQQQQPEQQPQQQPSTETSSVRAQAFAQQGEIVSTIVLEASSTSSAL